MYITPCLYITSTNMAAAMASAKFGIWDLVT